MKKTIHSIFLAGLALLAVAAPAQTPAEHAKNLSRYEREQGGSGGVFRQDPNIWVYTRQVARDTGIVQVRTGTSDHVQQFDPATGEVSEALRTGSDAAEVYESLLDVLSNPQVSPGESEQFVDASGGLHETSRQAMGSVFSNYLEKQSVQSSRKPKPAPHSTA
jgi:hypothetical protein